MTRILRLSAIALLFAFALPGRGAAQPAPYRRYLTLSTAHFDVHVAAGLEREGRVAAAAAERAYEGLSRELVAPRGRIDLLVSDDADYSNGYATPYPTNRIVVFATPPIGARELRLNDDWLRVVVTHELTHIFHLDRTRGVWSALQSVFGRVPYLFPNAYAPSWLTEGLAVYYETRLTEGGRLRATDERALARSAAADHVFPRLDQLSRSAPGFPGGASVYAYGSLFIDYLARTRGDSSVPRFIEAESGQIIPLAINRAARQGFGISFEDAYAAFADSVNRTTVAAPPLPGWRELTTQGFVADAPRWVNDTTIAYTGTDGKESNAAWLVTLGGARTRLTRRASTEASVPLRDGALLYAQLEGVGTGEVRSDLYVDRGGETTRLTHGARYVTPDARADGAIVAVQLAAARSSLVLLTADGALVRTLRDAAPDETWSEPRWSPDGTQVAAIHRAHGGVFSLQVLDVGTGNVAVADRGRTLITSPSWAPDGRTILYVSDESGASALSYAVRDGAQWRHLAPPAAMSSASVYTPELSPRGDLVAAVALRGDGYHVGVAPAAPLLGRAFAELAAPQPAAVRADSQPLATGSYASYSPWRTLLPRYWVPVIETGVAKGDRYGALTSGQDAVGRHLYSAYAAVQGSGHYPVGAFGYRYAGLRRPFIDAGISQEWESIGFSSIQPADSRVELLRRTQDISLAATFARPRVRTYSAVTAGIGLERRSFDTNPLGALARIDTSLGHAYDFPRAFVGATWSNAQRPALSISPEDGIAVGFTARQRWRVTADHNSTTSLVGTAQGYKSLALPGFAHHVLALRVAGGFADDRAGTAFELGGTSGSVVDVGAGISVGEGRRTFGVRGYGVNVISGTRALAGSLEYRAPLILGGRGFGGLPVFFDRSSLTLFADAGTAACGAGQRYAGVCSPAPFIGRTIGSAGGELSISGAFLGVDDVVPVRLGIAFPFVGRDLFNVGERKPAVAELYAAFGLSF